MSTTTPFDILFRNFFDRDLGYLPAAQTKIAHPLDIYYNDEGLFFEVACTGLSKKDIDINIEGQEISISYQKPKKRRSFQEGTSIMVLVRSHLDSAIRSYLNTTYPKLQQIWKTDY